MTKKQKNMNNPKLYAKNTDRTKSGRFQIMILKGVSKCVVEIRDAGSEYFEKALFFVKPEYCGVDENKLRAKAESLAKSADRPPRNKKTAKQKVPVAAGILCGAAAGAALTGFLAWLF